MSSCSDQEIRDRIAAMLRSEVLVFPDRMTVSLTTDVGLEAASPDPVAECVVWHLLLYGSTAPTQ